LRKPAALAAMRWPALRSQDPASPSQTDVLPFYRGGPQRLARIALAIALALLATWMLWAFLPALAWAGVLAIATWPFYNLCHPHIGRTWTATTLVLGLAAGLLIPIYIFGTEAAREAAAVLEWLQSLKSNNAAPPEWLVKIPLIGTHLSAWLQTYISAWPHELSAGLNIGAIAEWGQVVGAQLISRFLTLFIALVVLLCLYLDGDSFLGQASTVIDRLFGRAVQRLAMNMIATVRETVNGSLLIAVGEGIAFGVGYFICGLPHPALLGALTGVLAVVPFGAQLVIGIAALTLFIQSSPIAAIGLAIFGSSVILAADHVLRPLLIGGAGRLPFVWILLGIFGGISAFGLVGLFLGPAIVAALIALWRDLATPR
jgi:predicted PurR-regulated permease PerM